MHLNFEIFKLEHVSMNKIFILNSKTSFLSDAPQLWKFENRNLEVRYLVFIVVLNVLFI